MFVAARQFDADVAGFTEIKITDSNPIADGYTYVFVHATKPGT